MLVRPTMEELNEIETEFNKTKLAEFTIPTYSYVSVVELSNYLPAGRILMKILKSKLDYIQLYQKLVTFAFIQWINVVKEMTIGTCFLWKNDAA